MAPLIGISSSVDSRRGMPDVRVSREYAAAVAGAGGTGMVLPVMTDHAMAAAYVQALDGLLLTGGNEVVQPQHYGERAFKGISRVCPERDTWEFALFEAAVAQGKPVLGICRGCHIIAVALGGSLYQDVRAQVAGASEHDPCHTAPDALFHAVKLEEGGRLHNIFETATLMVNSRHNQAVKNLPASLRVSARGEDGLIEAVESVVHPFVVGVQWHPESLVERNGQYGRLFQAFMEAAERRGVADSEAADGQQAV